MTFAVVRRFVATLWVWSVCALPAFAQAQSDADRVLDLMRITETVEIMRDEGIVYAESLAEQMLPVGLGASWDRALERIYAPETMEAVVRQGFGASLVEQGIAVTDTLDFLSSDLGGEVISLEISARRAMGDSAIEETARAAYRALLEEDAETSRLSQIERIVTEHGLIDANVVGGMNSSVRFYQGLADGDAIGMSEGDILAEVWGSEGETRADTTEWLYGFMLMAYGPLSDSEMDRYTAAFETPGGRAVNRALFAGFDTMFAEISYALGQAISFEMRAQDL